MIEDGWDWLDFEDGGKAFPSERDAFEMCRGVSLRDYFAARAMEAFIIGAAFNHDSFLYTEISNIAYDMADEMLKARSKEQE